MRPHAGTGGHLRRKAANAQRLQNLLSHADFFGAIAAGSGSERDADGVADAFLQQHAQRGARCHDAFGAHAGFGEPEVQRIIAARRQRAVDVNQVLHSADFGAENNLIGPQSVFLRQAGGIQRAHYHGFHGDFARVLGFGQQRILVHHAW